MEAVNTDQTANSEESAANPLPTTPQEHNFTFSGNGAEFFRIWIVNIFLSIITLGIYSAWAKVRTTRYFYGNTQVAGASFEYLANPITILKGRLIAVAVLAVYLFGGYLIPGIELLFLVLLFVGTPWLIVRSLAFNARNSAYRNIRFNFSGKTGMAAKEFIAFPLLLLPTLGLLFPYISFRQTRFVVDNHHYGKGNFNFSASAGAYYKLFAIAFAVMIGLLIAGSLLLAGSMAPAGPEEPPQISPGVIAFVLILYGGMAIVGVYVQVGMLNLFFNNAKLQEQGFQSSLKVSRMLWLHLTNLLGMLLTLGLFYPWAKVRIARYRAQQLSLMATGDLDNFAAAQIDDVSATGDELGEAFGIELGI